MRWFAAFLESKFSYLDQEENLKSSFWDRLSDLALSIIWFGKGKANFDKSGFPFTFISAKDRDNSFIWIGPWIWLLRVWSLSQLSFQRLIDSPFHLPTHTFVIEVPTLTYTAILFHMWEPLVKFTGSSLFLTYFSKRKFAAQFNLFSIFQQSLARIIRFIWLLVSKPSPAIDFGIHMFFQDTQLCFLELRRPPRKIFHKLRPISMR